MDDMTQTIMIHSHDLTISTKSLKYLILLCLLGDIKSRVNSTLRVKEILEITYTSITLQSLALLEILSHEITNGSRSIKATIERCMDFAVSRQRSRHASDGGEGNKKYREKSYHFSQNRDDKMLHVFVTMTFLVDSILLVGSFFFNTFCL